MVKQKQNKKGKYTLRLKANNALGLEAYKVITVLPNFCNTNLNNT